MDEFGFEFGLREAGDARLEELLDRLEFQESLSAEAPPDGVLKSAAPRPKRRSPDTVITGFPFGLDDFVPRVPQDIQNRVADLARVILAGGIKDPILLIGHTDPVGTHPYNVDLGKRRAATIRRMLNLSMERIRKGSWKGLTYEIRSPGETQPVMPNDSEEHRALNRRVEVFLAHTRGGTQPPDRRLPWVPPPSPVPPQPEPRPPYAPPYVKPTYPRLPFPDPRTIDQPPLRVRDDRDGPSHWVWDALKRSAGVLGIPVSSRLWSVGTNVVKKAIEIALEVLAAKGISNVGIGAAGEAVAAVILEDELAKTTGGRVFNLNRIKKNFPVFDVISPIEIKSVKTYGALTQGGTYKEVASGLMKAFREVTGMQESHEWRGYPRKVQKLSRAAQLIWDNRHVTGLREALPSALRAARSAEDVYAYLAENGRIAVASDQVIRFRAEAARFLASQWSPGDPYLKGPAGRQIAARIQTNIFRIQDLGFSTRDFRNLVEAARQRMSARGR